MHILAQRTQVRQHIIEGCRNTPAYRNISRNPLDVIAQGLFVVIADVGPIARRRLSDNLTYSLIQRQCGRRKALTGIIVTGN
jgi:hypothetical protein